MKAIFRSGEAQQICQDQKGWAVKSPAHFNEVCKTSPKDVLGRF